MGAPSMPGPERGPNDLGVLTPESRRLALADGGVLCLSPLRVRQIGPFLAALSPAWDDMAGTVDVWGLIAAHEGPLLEALAVAADVPRSAIDAMRPPEQLAALAAVAELNADLLADWLAAPADGDAPAATKTGWADQLQSLVSAGHSAREVMGYTLAQVRWWGAAVERERNSRQADAVVAARMAWADPKDARAYVRELEG